MQLDVLAIDLIQIFWPTVILTIHTYLMGIFFNNVINVNLNCEKFSLSMNFLTFTDLCMNSKIK
jgi:hypothetical protein